MELDWTIIEGFCEFISIAYNMYLKIPSLGENFLWGYEDNGLYDFEII